MVSSTQQLRSELLKELEQLHDRERQVLVRLRELLEDRSTSEDRMELHEHIERREQQIAKMRGSVTYYGDIVSPLDVEWEAGR